jgi:ribonucleoside-diphosphate reductase alpha chain
MLSGISFLPHTEHSYRQAPYQECDEETYKKALSEMPTGVDWSELGEYETEDTTESYKELACSAGSCEI